MPKITEKGITPIKGNINELQPELKTWLDNLQMRFPKVYTYEESINPASVGATSYSSQTFTVEGLTTDDVIAVNPPSLTSGLYLISYRVSAADTLSLTFYNSTGSPIDEGAGTYKILTCRL